MLAKAITPAAAIRGTAAAAGLGPSASPPPPGFTTAVVVFAGLDWRWAKPMNSV